MQYNIEESIKISINDLSLGMFVTGIENNKRINLSNAGRVSTQSGIERLISNDIKYVYVDEGLSAHGCVIKPLSDDEGVEPAAARAQTEAVKRKPRKYSRTTQQKQAKKLIKEAKTLAQRLLNVTFNSQPLDVSDIEVWADELIEVALVDSDALHCVSALRSKDTYLLEHSVNVACLLVTFGKYLNMDSEMLKSLAIGGIIHDVGKVKVDDDVLHKPSKLTPEEFEHMKMHQVYAQEIIHGVRGLNKVSRDVCLMHHEKIDGTGYPNGLRGAQLPTVGRMSSIVDIYDALTADRCYKSGMSSAEAFKIILTLTPNQLDRELVYKFINCIGMYPVGSLVELSDGRVGIVWISNQSEPLKPTVKCFYSNKYQRYTEVSYVDLKSSAHKIIKAVSPKSLRIDSTPFYEE
ncbi:HD-GYP domain-containing protein [Vibrio sp. FNV 38]|nr:HD-GYP domain-containing protein [Vibrio sp. FNV 38]